MAPEVYITNLSELFHFCRYLSNAAPTLHETQIEFVSISLNSSANEN